jgi:hypothetical protein
MTLRTCATVMGEGKMPICKKPAALYCTDSKKYKRKRRDVYHTYKNCPYGKRIKKKHRKLYVSPPVRLPCKECQRMATLPDCPA